MGCKGATECSGRPSKPLLSTKASGKASAPSLCPAGALAPAAARDVPLPNAQRARCSVRAPRAPRTWLGEDVGVVFIVLEAPMRQPRLSISSCLAPGRGLLQPAVPRPGHRWKPSARAGEGSRQLVKEGDCSWPALPSSIPEPHVCLAGVHVPCPLARA